LLSIASGKVAPITQNPSFENGLAPWTPFTGSNVAPRLEIVPGAGLTGNTALRCSNIHDRGGIMQLAPIAPGEYVAVAPVYVETTAGLRFVAAGAHPRGPGKSVTHRERRAMPVPGEWTTIAWKFTAPAKVDGVATPNTLLLVYASADQPITMLLD